MRSSSFDADSDLDSDADSDLGSDLVCVGTDRFRSGGNCCDGGNGNGSGIGDRIGSDRGLCVPPCRRAVNQFG